MAPFRSTNPAASRMVGAMNALTPIPRTYQMEAGGPDLALAARFYGAGEARCRAVPHLPPAEKHYAGPCIGAVICGVVDYFSQSGGGVAGPGSIVFGNAGESFGCRHIDPAGNRRSVIALSAEILAEVADDCGFEDPAFRLAVLPPSRRAASLYGAIRQAAAGVLAEDGVLELIGAALRISRDVQPPLIAPTERGRVLAVARLLDSAYDEPLSLADMASSAQLSLYHFVRVFRAVVGDSPRQYLIGVRLRAAANRLLDTREPITSIALDVGFNDISHFNATFRRAFGASPGTWRKAA